MENEDITNAEQLTTTVVEVARQHMKCHIKKKKRVAERILNLSRQRACSSTPEERDRLSKLLLRARREDRRKQNDILLDELIELRKVGRDFKHILQGPKKKRMISAATDKDGQVHTKTNEIAEVFATFYESLYSIEQGETNFEDNPIRTAVTLQEIKSHVRDIISTMKKNKTCAEDGLVAEMLQTGNEGLLNAISMVFTDLLAHKSPIPTSWRNSKLIVLFKKGDVKLPSNYRPIAILPVLCKLYSKVLLKRISGTLENLRTPEEIGFRKDYQCGDLIHVLRLIGEKASEWGETVWMASLDLEKAFDKLVHTAVFHGLAAAGIDDITMEAIKDLYRQQHAFVDLDEHTKSRLFRICRGVRQGDPMSPALFSNSIRIIMELLKDKWEKEQLGTNVGSDSRGKARLTYIMFADDTTIVAKSKQALRKMLFDLCSELRKIGLTLNAQKCKIQCSKPRLHGDTVLKTDILEFPIVSKDEGFKILGTVFTLNGNVDVEIQRRQDAAWAKFHELTPLLLKHDANLLKRLQLFNATVSQTFLWGAESWNLSAKQKREIRSVQRDMLRKIVGIRRQLDEDWLEWVRRCSPKTQEWAKRAGVDCWVSKHLHLKWEWAGRVQRMSFDRWAKKVTIWRDSEWASWQWQGGPAYGTRPMRSRRGHFQRWETDFVNYANHLGQPTWQSLAENQHTWEQHAQSFVDYVWN